MPRGTNRTLEMFELTDGVGVGVGVGVGDGVGVGVGVGESGDTTEKLTDAFPEIFPAVS